MGKETAIEIRLLVAAGWWIGMLRAALDRVGETISAVGFVGSIEQFSEHKIAEYFDPREIEAIMDRTPSPNEAHARLQSDAILAILSLSQIERTLRRLSSLPVWQGDLARKGQTFREIFRSENLRDLRNVIVHAEEHIALNKGDIARDFDSFIGVQAIGPYGPYGGGILRVHAFGNDYKVITAIEAAILLEPLVDYEIPPSMVRPPPDSFKL